MHFLNYESQAYKLMQKLLHTPYIWGEMPMEEDKFPFQPIFPNV